MLPLLLSFQPLASGKCSFFKLCLSAEQVPVRLDTYRDKLVCLQKLRFSPAFYDALPDFFRDAALLYLSGMLYVNFSPLWDPVIEIIASFAQSSNVKHFWKIFSELLDTAAEKTGRKEKTLTHPDSFCGPNDECRIYRVCDVVSCFYFLILK